MYSRSSHVMDDVLEDVDARFSVSDLRAHKNKMPRPSHARKVRGNTNATHRVL